MAETVKNLTVTRGIAESDIIEDEVGGKANGLETVGGILFTPQFYLFTFTGDFLQTVDAGCGVKELGQHVQQTHNRLLNLTHQLQE